jgi:hypothetical protein
MDIPGLSAEDRKNWSKLSEDVKDELTQRMLFLNKRKNKGKGRGGPHGTGVDIHTEMVKDTFNQMRSIINKEDGPRSKIQVNKKLSKTS